MEVDSGLANISFGSDDVDGSNRELWYVVAEETAAVVEARTYGFGWAVGFACAVKLFDSQADAAMHGWLVEARLNRRSALADRSMDLLLQKLQDAFGLMVCCTSCDAKSAVLDFTDDAGDVCMCMCSALLCRYFCGTAARLCCRLWC